MKSFLGACGFGLAGVIASVGAAAFAAGQWTTLSDKWLFAAFLLPALGVLGGARLGAGKEGWPPARAGLLGLWGLSGVLAGLSGYLAYAAVALTWDGASGADFLARACTPMELPDLHSSTGSGSGHSIGWIWHTAVGAIVGIAFCIQVGPSAKQAGGS